MIEAVIFDLDGVLIDSEQLMRRAFCESYRQIIGDGDPPIEEYLEHMGESFPRIMDKLNLPRALWEPFRQFCRSNLDQINFFPEARPLLEQLVQLQSKLAIVTGKDYSRTIQILEHFRVRSFFPVVVGSDQIQNPKPHPEGVLVALDRLGSTPENALMIGDSVSDILSAQAAGVLSIAVTWGIKPERVCTLCVPDYIVRDWTSLSDLLINLTRKKQISVVSA
jgi:3-amino-5-hydroxybenzoic acid synthesis related protein